MLQVFYDKKFHELEPQNQGYLLYFGHNIQANSMLNSSPARFTRASWNLNKFSYDTESLLELGSKNIEWSSAINWASPKELTPGKKYFDFDMSAAYPNYLLDYKARKLGLLVGQSKRYHHFTCQIPENNEYVWIYKVSFNLYHEDLHNTRFFRRWISESSLNRKKIMDTGTSIAGTIFLPTSRNMKVYDKFIEDLNYYDGEASLEAVIETYGDTDYIYINDKNLDYDVKCKNNPEYNPEARAKVKMRLNSSTGWLNLIDPVFYSTMVNHVKLRVILMHEYIEKNGLGEVVGSNTDGVTLISDEESMFALFHDINDLEPNLDYVHLDLLEYQDMFGLGQTWRIKNPRTQVKFTERRVK